MTSGKPWKAVDEGMDFYRKCADIIKYGTTILIDQPDTSYNKLKGSQLLTKASIKQLANTEFVRNPETGLYADSRVRSQAT